MQIPNQQPFKPKNISRAINHTQLAATAGDHRLIKGSWKSNPKVNCDGKKTLFLILAWQEPSSSVGSVFWGQYRVFVPQGCALLTTKAFLSPAARDSWTGLSLLPEHPVLLALISNLFASKGGVCPALRLPLLSCRCFNLVYVLLLHRGHTSPSSAPNPQAPQTASSWEGCPLLFHTGLE